MCKFKKGDTIFNPIRNEIQIIKSAKENSIAYYVVSIEKTNKNRAYISKAIDENCVIATESHRILYG